MKAGRIPVSSARPLTGFATNGSECLIGQNTTTNKSQNQPLCGNKCGHAPKSLRFYSRPPEYRTRFHVLEAARRTILLALADPYSYPALHGFMYRNHRQKRSERREAELALLMPAIADTVYLANMQCGHLVHGKFENYTYAKYKQLTGMSEWRVARNMRRLQEAGLITVRQVLIEHPNGETRVERVIISVTHKFFELLGLTHELEIDRARAAKSHAKHMLKFVRRDAPIAPRKMQKAKDTPLLHSPDYNPNDRQAEKAAFAAIQDKLGAKNALQAILTKALPDNRPQPNKRTVSTLVAVQALIKAYPNMPMHEAIRLVSQQGSDPPD